jgi:phosphomannomutase
VAAFYADESFPLPVVETLRRRVARHAGIVVCSQDPDADRLAAAIDVAARCAPTLAGALIRVNRPG